MMCFDLLPKARRRPLVTLLVPLLATFGCDCIGDRLVIVDPDAGRVYTEADDLDVDASGLQQKVIVDGTGIPWGTEIELRVGLDEETLVEAGTVFRGILQPSSRATIDVTLPTGTVFLVACVNDDGECRPRSPVREVTVVGSVGDCPFVQFVEPAASGSGTLMLGAANDAATADGACGAAFAVPVRATVDGADGQVATLFVDGIPTATANVADGEVRFASVQLGVRGAVDTTMLTLSIGDDTCVSSFPQPIGVDCAGPSCRLEQPIEGVVLNNTLDADTSTAVLDLNVTADAPVATVGETFSLMDDTANAEIDTAIAIAMGSQASGRFLGVPFAEGPARFFAECTDGTLSTRSAIAAYLVDTTGCSVTIDAPLDGATITNMDDTDATSSNGIQLTASMTTSGTDCTDVRIAPCAAIPATTFTALTDTTPEAILSLGTSGTQTICAEVRDAAGNLGKDQITVGVVPDGTPMVTIVTPVAATKVNIAGGVGFVADLAPASTSCELGVTVDCSAIGTPVELYLDGAVAAVGSSSCVANASSSLGGRATFASVSIPASVTSAHSFIARQTVSGVTGASTAVAITSDCEPPVLVITTPATCPATLGAADDVSAAAGMQAPVTVSSPNVPQLDLTVTVQQAGAGMSTATSLAANLPGGATSHSFSAIEFGGAGTASLRASATDAFNNTTTTSACSVTITDLPTIQLTALATTTFNSSNAATFDCNTGNTGLDLTISGTTNATAGSSVTLQIGSGAAVNTTVGSNAFSACVPAPEGASNVTASVNDLVPSDGTSGMASALPIAITVSTVSPTNAIAPYTVGTVDRRAGVMTLAFTAIGDSSNMPLVSYEVRCSHTTIPTEPAWDAATVMTMDPHTPANPGVTDTITVHGFLTGTRTTCIVRGRDSGGNLSQIPSPLDDAIVSPQFLVATYNGTVSGGSIGVAGARAAGDVNGDSIPDFVVSGVASAYLFLGQAGGAAPVLATTFTKSQASNYFGAIVRGIGDFNRDGINDVVVTDYAEAAFDLDGEVYVFYGRANWPSSIVVSETGCNASFCVRGGAGTFLGLGTDAIGLGNFDGLAGADFAIGAGFGDAVYILSSRDDIASGTEFVLGASDPTGFVVSRPSASGDFGWTLGAPGNITGTANTDLVIGEFANPSILHRLAGQNLVAGSSGLTSIPAASLTSIAGGVTLSGNFGTYDHHGIASGDFDGDSAVDLFAFSIDAAQVDVGTYILYGSAGADYPIPPGHRVRSGVSTTAESYFGTSRGFAFDPNFGHLGDVNLDGRDELLAGGMSVTTDGNFSVGLVYGRTTRPTSTLTVNDDPRFSGALQPAIETYPTSNPFAFWTVGFIGNSVQDTVTAYPDLVVCDPGTTDPSQSGTGDRIFVLY